MSVIAENIVLHRAETRGFADHGWLKSRHTFSFASYFNPERISFGTLRVLNDDMVEGGAGFGTHPHDNMEIISIPLSGQLEHKDTTGNTEIIRPGEVQIMSAGSGLHHSEYNHSKTEPVSFLQIWVLPRERNIKPRYDQKYFELEKYRNKLLTVVSPDQSDALWINQDAWFSIGSFEAGKELSYSRKKDDNGIYVFVIEGQAIFNDIDLKQRDGLGIINEDEIILKAQSEAKILIMDIPMKF
jgi:redox-sensitive bicupin YhaK (pirin superfamily)